MNPVSRNVPLLYILKATTALGFFYPIWYLLEQQFLSITQIAVIEVIIVVSQLLLEIPTGSIADIFGYKVSMIAGWILTLFTLVLFVSATTMNDFILYAVILGLASSLISGADEAMDYDTFSAMGKAKDFARIKNNFSLVFQLSLAFAFFTGGLIADKFGYAATIYLTMITTVFSIIVAAFLIEPPVERHKHTFRSYLKQWRRGFHEVTKNDQVKTISSFYTLVGSMTWPVALSLLAMYLAQVEFSASTQGIILGITRILNIIILGLIIKRTAHHQNVSKVMLAYIGIFALGYLPVAFTPPILVPILVMIMLMSTTARWNIIGPLVHHQLESRNRATAMSTLSMGIGISHALVMIIAVFSLTVINGPKGLITLMGLLGLMGTLALRHHYPANNTHAPNLVH